MLLPMQTKPPRVSDRALSQESQRDSILQPRVGAQRLPWDIVPKKIINPNGVVFHV